MPITGVMELSKIQRVILWIVSAIGLFGINGLFLYAAIFRPEQMEEVHTNLFAMAFIIEAFVLLPLFCYLIAVAGFKSPGWKSFLVLSLVGSLAFSIPFSFLRWSRGSKQ
jgi:hypothetical protein